MREQLVYITVEAENEEEVYGLIDEFAHELNTEHPAVTKIEVASTFPEVYGIFIDNIICEKK
jgi:hypothetical protein